MDKAKIQLSAEEIELVQNAGFILTKNLIIKKVYALFGEVAADMQAYIEQHADSLPLAVIQSAPKISRGEQYEGLPYVMLDYPRCFGKEDILAVRTFFWWGNYFSSTIHVKGIYRDKLSTAIGKNPSFSGKSDMHLSDTGDEWSHDVFSQNYQALSGWLNGISSAGNSSSFLKLTAKHNLIEWETAHERLINNFECWMRLLEE